MGTREASLQSLQAGADLLCIGNNLLNEEKQMADIADYIEGSASNGTLAGLAVRKSIERIGRRKTLLN